MFICTIVWIMLTAGGVQEKTITNSEPVTSAACQALGQAALAKKPFYQSVSYTCVPVATATSHTP